jgi:hypothetical protein
MCENVTNQQQPEHTEYQEAKNIFFFHF